MGDDRKVSKRPVNLTLNEHLVREAQSLAGDLSGKVEALLEAFVEAEGAKRAERERQIDAYIAWSNEWIARNGAWGEEFSTL
jgi:post-segregation antitoxin (ccd killing protein)